MGESRCQRGKGKHENFEEGDKFPNEREMFLTKFKMRDSIFKGKTLRDWMWLGSLDKSMVLIAKYGKVMSDLKGERK